MLPRMHMMMRSVRTGITPLFRPYGGSRHMSYMSAKGTAFFDFRRSFSAAFHALLRPLPRGLERRYAPPLFPCIPYASMMASYTALSGFQPSIPSSSVSARPRMADISLLRAVDPGP